MIQVGDITTRAESWTHRPARVVKRRMKVLNTKSIPYLTRSLHFDITSLVVTFLKNVNSILEHSCVHNIGKYKVVREISIKKT